MSYQIMCVGPNLPASLQKKAQFHVHTADCADLKRAALRSAVRETGSLFEVENLFEIVTTVYDPESFEWDPTDAGDAAAYWGDFHFAPCVKEIPTGFPEPGEDDTEGISAEDLLTAAAYLEGLANLVGGSSVKDIDELAARLRSAAGGEEEA